MASISMIMPVYNSEDYLASAIQCVLNQTMKDFELILVDDGSTDKSGEICDSFAKRDSRIVVIHQKNGGICRARNKGLEAANGEYVAFMDNDDEIAKTNLKMLNDHALYYLKKVVLNPLVLEELEIDEVKKLDLLTTSEISE